MPKNSCFGKSLRGKDLKTPGLTCFNVSHNIEGQFLIKAGVRAHSLPSCPTLCDPMDCM